MVQTEGKPPLAAKDHVFLAGEERRGGAGGSVVAMDADEETLNLIKLGAIDSTIAEKPFTMAYYGLKALDEIHHYPVNLKRGYSWDAFSPFPTFVDTGSTLVDKSNVDAYLKSREEAQAK